MASAGPVLDRILNEPDATELAPGSVVKTKTDKLLKNLGRSAHEEAFSERIEARASGAFFSFIAKPRMRLPASGNARNAGAAPMDK